MQRCADCWGQDDRVIDGQKTCLTHGGSSSLVATSVCTDEGAERAHRNLTTLLVKQSRGFGEAAPRLTIPGKIEQMGYKGLDATEVVSAADGSAPTPSSAECPARAWPRMDGVEVGRVEVAARGCGIRALRVRAGRRPRPQWETFGKPIARHRAIAFALAEVLRGKDSRALARW